MLDRLLQMINKQDTRSEGKIHLYNHLCLNVRSGRRVCQACEDICPVQGIEQKEATVNIGDCMACGLCAVACPTGVFDQLWDAADKVVGVAKNPRPNLWISCHKASPIKGSLRINCLGELTPELILYLLRQGITAVNILYESEVCEKCICQSGQINWDISWQKLRSIYPQEKQCFYVYKRLPENEPNEKQEVDLDRRGFLRSFTAEAKQVMAQLILKQPEGKTPQPFMQRLSLRRQLFRHVITQLDPDQAAKLEPGYLRHPEIALDCTFCGSCATMCPSGAMKMEQLEDGLIVLSVDPIACNMCGFCAAICPARAVTVDWAIPNDSPAQRVVLNQAGHISCSECGEIYWGHSDIRDSMCPSCSNSQTKPKMIWSELITEIIGGAVSGRSQTFNE